MSTEPLHSDFDKVSYLVNILIARATGGDASASEYKELRHELLSNQRISNILPAWLKTQNTLDTFWGFIRSKFKSYSDRRKYISDEFSYVLNILEFDHTIDIEEQNKQTMAAVQNFTVPKKKVFIVHGHDNEAKQEVSRFIESLNIEVIILHEQASSGMTIIEKIEHYSGEADFALVLYTACDLGRGIKETKVHPRNRARQNVVFEHGYLMAKLGRKNVCALVKGEIETPNDISGVVYVGLDSPGTWKMEVKKELYACGYTFT